VSWGVAALVAAVPAVTHAGLPVVLAVLACMSAASSCAVAAGAAAPTWMPAKPDLIRAGSWLVVATYLPVGAGPAGASNLFAHAGQQAAWALVAGLLAVASASSLLVRAVRPAATGAPAMRFRIRPAVRGVLAITAGIYVSWGAVTILEPLYVRAVLARPLPVYGWLLCTWAAAAIVTAIAASRCQPIVTARWAVPLWALLVAVGEGLYLGTSLPAAAFTGAAVFGVGATLFGLSCRAVIVAVTPPAEHGRALSLWFTVQDASLTLPAALAGPAVAVFGLRAALDGAAALAAVSSAAKIAIRAPRRPARPSPRQTAAGARSETADITRVIAAASLANAAPWPPRRGTRSPSGPGRDPAAAPRGTHRPAPAAQATQRYRERGHG
jgi:hypothetical protein